MTQARERVARQLLVEGYPVEVDGRARRVYPRYARVARELGVPTSTVTRWAARTQIAALRRRQLRDDRAAGTRAVARPTADAMVRAAMEVVRARLKAGRAVSTRDLDRVLRVLEWLAGLAPMQVSELARLEGFVRRLAVTV